MAAAPATIGAGPAKLKIKIKGLSVLGAKQKAQQQQVSTGLPNGVPAVIGDQLADLHAAVEAFCHQGLRGLPGAVLLSPWREPSPVEQLAPWGEPLPLQEQQGIITTAHAQQQQQLQEHQVLQPLQQGQKPGQRRVRKRRAPDPQQLAEGEAAAEPQDLQHLAWGNLKRRRTNHQRAARDAAQLSTSIHSMLPGDAAAATPASPSVVSQPRAAGVPAPARSSGRAAAAAGGQQPSRLQRSSSRLGSPEPPAAAAAAAAPAVQHHAPSAVPAAEKSEPAAARAMDVAVATAEPAPAAAGAATEAAVAMQQQQQELRQRQEAKQEPPAEDEDMQQAQQLNMQLLQQQQPPGSKQQQQREVPLRTQQQVVNQEQDKPLASSGAAVHASAPQVAAEQPAAAAAVAAVSEPAGPAAAAADLKPESPPSETSHQQHMPAPQQLQQQLLPQSAGQEPAAAVKQQHQQERESPQAPELQVQPIKQPEQTAVSRDRSQCSLPRAADQPGGAAAVSMPAPAAAVPAAAPAGASNIAAAAAGCSSGRLLELAPGAMTDTARSLAFLSAVPEVRQRVLPPEDRPVRTQEEAITYLQTIMDKAKQLKHQGDRRYSSLGGWDVFGLSFYALSSVEFLMYWDTLQRLLNKLRAANQPVGKLQQMQHNCGAGFLRQTGQLSITAMGVCMNSKGNDLAKMSLRMLLERISAICQLRTLHAQRKYLEGHIRMLKTNGASYGAGSCIAAGGSARAAPAPQQQQQGGQQAAPVQQQAAARLQAQRAVAAAAAGKPPSPSGSSWSPAGAGAAQQQQQFNKRSPDDSNASNQERVQLPVGGEHAAGVGGAAGAAAPPQGGQDERALALVKSERALMESMQELLKLTDSMHQTVMRMSQFLERPEVLASELARTAALHVSVLGLDAGMFSIPRVAAHTEAAVTCITKLLRSS